MRQSNIAGFFVSTECSRPELRATVGEDTAAAPEPDAPKKRSADGVASDAPLPALKKRPAPPRYEPSSQVVLDGRVMQLSPEQHQVLQMACDGDNLFFTGSAGTGKSLLLRAIVQELRNIHGAAHVFVTASTGIAACNVSGTSLHSFAGVGLGKGTSQLLLSRARRNAQARERWITAKVLVIDEISMISADLWEHLDYIGRVIRRRPELPWGGMQLIVCGDFLQLKPVYKPDQERVGGGGDDEGPVPLITDRFAFESPKWRQTFARPSQSVHLTRIFRQRDEHFVDLLQAVRLGSPTAAHLQMLRGCLGRRLDVSDGIKPTCLYSHLVDVRTRNTQELGRLTTPEHVFNATDAGARNYREFLDRNCPAAKEVTLKEGAQVMLLKNLDFQAGLVNGARGVVMRFEPDGADTSTDWPVVRFHGELERTLKPETWEIELAGTVVASRKQVPLALAYALSIHKSMGQTLDKVTMRLASAFEYGQVYVALSRCTSLEGISLSDFDPSKIRAHPKVLAFYQQLESL